MVVCDGLKGLPAAVETVWPQAIVQTCVVHLLRNSFRYAPPRDWDEIAKALKPVYTAAERGRGAGAVPGVRRGMGAKLSGDRQAVVERLGRVRALPRLRRRDPQGDLLDERDRERECPHPQGRPGPRALPERAGRAQVRLYGDHEPGPDGQRPATLDQAMEGPAERLRDRLPGND